MNRRLLLGALATGAAFAVAVQLAVSATDADAAPYRRVITDDGQAGVVVAVEVERDTLPDGGEGFFVKPTIRYTRTTSLPDGGQLSEPKHETTRRCAITTPAVRTAIENFFNNGALACVSMEPRP